MMQEEFFQDIFSIQTDRGFEEFALKTFHYQAVHNPVYKKFLLHLQVEPSLVRSMPDIPFLPIQFFKSHRVVSGKGTSGKIFSSSGTTGSQASKHHILHPEIYIRSFLNGFTRFYGDPSEWIILGLLPSYLERKDSSLVYMVDYLIKAGKNRFSGFYLHNYEALIKTIDEARKKGNRKILLLGVSFALYDLAALHQPDLKVVTVMETGGMKGRRIEPLREELHAFLCKNLNVSSIHSEYGMTELLSQAYSQGNGVFNAPPWMRIQIRDTGDPYDYMECGRSGGINVIDLANLYSCSFIATQDLGKLNSDGSFEVIGRFDNSDVRGCNLLVTN
jgi:hypothetical protein